MRILQRRASPGFNGALTQTLDYLASNLAVEIVRFDTYTAFDQIVADAASARWPSSAVTATISWTAATAGTSLFGQAGNDRLFRGSGYDWLDGGRGDDEC